MIFKTALDFSTAGTANNKRSIGPYDADNGYFFLLDGTTFKVVSRTDESGGAVDTEVSSGSFNGDSATYVMDTNTHKMSIEYSMKIVSFIIDGNLIHSMALTDAMIPTTQTFHITMENDNSGGQDAAVEMHVRGCGLFRIGPLYTNPTYKYIAANATTVCKYGAGMLRSIINNDNSGNIQVYDGLSAGGVQMAGIDTTKVLGDIEFNASFSDGLTIVTASGAKITVIYE